MTDAASSAFPVSQYTGEPGMTVRTYMATHILAGLLSNPEMGLHESEELAEIAGIQTQELINVLQEYDRD